MTKPIRLGTAARLEAVWTTNPTVWTVAGYIRINNAGTASFFFTRGRADATDGVIGIYGGDAGNQLDAYVQTSAGGTPDIISSTGQVEYNTGTALVPFMQTRNGNIITTYTPDTPTGDVFDMSTTAAVLANLAADQTRLVFGAWNRNGTMIAHADADLDELAAWGGVVGTSAEYAEMTAGTPTVPELVGNTTFRAGLLDVWKFNLTAANGTAVTTGTVFEGLVNGVDLTLTGATATVSARTSPITRAAGPVITGPTGAAGDASITHSALEGQNVLGTWTATGTGAWSVTGTDAGLLTMTGGVVTLTSGNLDFETKSSYSFNVVRGSASQAVTLNVTNVVEISTPTRSTPTATTAAPGFTTDIATGEARCVLIAATSPPTTPSAAQVKAGQNAAGTTLGVVACTPLTITSTGVKVFAAATVTAGLTYYPFTVHTANGIDSAVLVGLPHFPGTGRPVADVSVAGWTATGAATLADALNENTSNRGTFITGPAVSGSPSLATFELSQPYPPGTYSVSIDADMVSGTGTARVKFFDAGGTLRGTGPDIALGTTAAVFTFNVTISGGTATRFGIETQA